MTAVAATALPVCADAYRNPALSPEQRVDDLLPRMTLEEKIGQMCQYVGLEFLREIAREKGTSAANDDATAVYPGMSIADIEREIREGRIGSFLHVLAIEEANALQKLAAESRLGIPLIIGIDAIHGNGLVAGATVYPTQIGLAATFDEGLAETIARQTAIEVRANGSHWTFSPNVEVARDPRWGRNGETFGEDPFLVGRMGAAMVRGYEGDSLNGHDRVLSCIKHLIAGSVPVNGLNIAPTDISERTIRSVFLPPFTEGVRAGSGSLMTAHHDLNGVPCHSNPWIVGQLMRREAGFQGFVVSDWMDIERLVFVQHVAENQKEAVYQSVVGGIDMHMHGPGYLEPLVELVREGRIGESRIDDSVRRILLAKFRLGLFEGTQIDPAVRAARTRPADHRETAIEAARKSICLLKNEGSVLPFNPGTVRRIVVTGPLADSPAILGDWAFAQPEENVTTVLEGLRAVAPAGVEIVHADCGPAVRDTAPDRIASAVALAATADAVVLVVGDNSLRYDALDKTGGENVDRSDIELPGRQLELAQSIAATGRPVVVVLVNGRPLAIEWIAENVPAIVEAWEPGGEGGRAVAEVLFGTVNPSGRLPVSFPRSAGHLQTHYNHKPSQYFRSYVQGKTGPLFEFGHGLSYTDFSYSNLRVPASVPPGGRVDLHVDVTNTGDRDGEHVVLAFVRDRFASVTVPVRELKAFRRISLRPGETATVAMSIDHEQLALVDRGMKLVVEPGDFDVFVGGLSGSFKATAAH